MVPIEILDAVQEDYSRDNSFKIFDTAFSGTSFHDSALTLQNWLNLVEKCLDTEKIEKLKNLEKKENYQRLRKADKERELENERAREINARKDVNDGDFSRHRLQYDRPSSYSVKETDNSRRRSIHKSNRENQEREQTTNYGFEANEEMAMANYMRDGREYSVCDARAHAVPERTSRDITSVRSGSAMRGGQDPGSGIRSRSSSTSLLGIKKNIERSSSIGRDCEGRGHGKEGSAGIKISNSYGNTNENKGKYVFADSGLYLPSASHGMMKTRVGHYAHRQMDKHQHQHQQQKQQHEHEQERGRDILNQNKKSPLISKANRAYKLRQQNAFATGGVDGKNGLPQSLESDQYDQTHKYNHRDWIRYSCSLCVFSCVYFILFYYLCDFILLFVLFFYSTLHCV